MKKYLSLFLILSVLIVNINVKSFAMEIPDHDFNYDSLESYWELMQDVGFIVSYPAYSTGRTLGGILKKYLNSVSSGSGDNINSDVDAGNWAKNNITINGDGNIVLNDNAKGFIKYSINDYINDSPYIYVYSFNLIDSLNSVNNGNYYNGIRKLLTSKQDEYICIIGSLYYSSSSMDAYLFKKENLSLVLNSIETTNNRVQADLYNNTSWLPYLTCDIYRYNNSSYEFELYQANFNFSGVHPSYQIDKTKRTSPSSFGYCFFTVGRYDTMICYRSLNDLKQASVGIQPYYINNSVYNNFSTSSGDYTVDNSNYNPVTYGDITNYVNSFNTENGTYPTPNDINIFIETYQPTPTPTPGPGDNTSGSFVNNNNPSIENNNNPTISNNPTFNNNPNINISLLPNVSGNGINGTVSGSGSGSSGNIFDWISGIGEVLGNLIKNLGNAIKSLVEGIADIVTSVLELIPNVFSGVFSALFEGLPPEFSALFSLGLAVGLIVSIIKIFRG